MSDDRMEVVNFDPEEHLGILNLWLMARGQQRLDADDLAMNGFAVRKDDELVAMGFLRAVEGSMGIFDGLSSNPACSSSDRHEALDLVMDAVMQAAGALGMSKVFAWTIDPTVMVRASRHRFKAAPHTVLIAHADDEPETKIDLRTGH